MKSPFVRIVVGKVGHQRDELEYCRIHAGPFLTTTVEAIEEVEQGDQHKFLPLQFFSRKSHVTDGHGRVHM